MTSRNAFEQLARDLTSQSLPVLRLSVERIESIKKEIDSMSLGERNRRKTIAAASASLNPLAQDSHKELAKLLSTIKIIKRYKRKSLIKFGDLTVSLGKYGVAIYFLPTGLTVEGLRLSIESFICSQSILDYIGAIPDGCKHGETIYNYSKCAVPVLQTEVA